ncbi:hypothetical protein EVAR_13218_1 [Eumeta japonica]|uniref:Uncharacterized protein n=1 Tax=Eumeta variegata TaxID=151549 RepID=A0A4C1TSN6_EUMVA|nr:hypothetical protein EVAR_13218_1 [Eumeta japonica]
MEENSMVRDLITKILDESSNEGQSSVQPSDKGLELQPNQYKNNASLFTPSHSGSTFGTFQDTLYNYNGGQQENGFNFSNTSNGFTNPNGFVNYPDSDVNSLLSLDTISEMAQEVTPEQLNLLRLATQEISAQFTNPNTNKFDDKYFTYFESNQRNSISDQSLYSVRNNFNRPNSLNLDAVGYNSGIVDTSYSNSSNSQRYPKYSDNYLKDIQNSPAQDTTDILTYLNQLNLSDQRQGTVVSNMSDFNKLSLDLNSHPVNYQNGIDDAHFNSKMSDDQVREKMYHFNRGNYQQMQNSNSMKNLDNSYYLNELMKQMGNEKSSFAANNQNFDMFSNTNVQNPVPNFKPNGYQQQNEPYMSRRDVNMMQMQRDNNYHNNNQGMNEFMKDKMQQATLMRQNELARQMSILMNNRPPPNQLNVDVSFLHENASFNVAAIARAIPDAMRRAVCPGHVTNLNSTPGSACIMYHF